MIHVIYYLRRDLNFSFRAGEEAKRPIELYHECSISAEIPNPSIQDGRAIVSGRADLAMGYSSGDGDTRDSVLLIAIEAKRSSGFGSSQLVPYLAILRENRRRAGKTNITLGFYSDGQCFEFVCVKDGATISQSRTYDISGLAIVYSFQCCNA